ncbi:hypothetical protein [Lactiplantibacillus paraplantarum]|nr:hypothetical protein [Lactiplantibacillus paraplantarum]KRL48002.1 hypothetical protein FD48_GL001270 [Lactiplantibacillus paraplantarum DSM 10667]WEE35100.1 hypothetical protein PWO93_10385 [Lactiplantibacillus paraplantarum]
MMRRYQPSPKSNGRVHHSISHNTNPYYGQRGADWVKNTNASLFNAQHERSQAKNHVERQVRHSMRQVLWVVVAIITMLLGGFILFSFAINI